MVDKISSMLFSNSTGVSALRPLKKIEDCFPLEGLTVRNARYVEHLSRCGKPNRSCAATAVPVV